MRAGHGGGTASSAPADRPLNRLCAHPPPEPTLSPPIAVHLSDTDVQTLGEGRPLLFDSVIAAHLLLGLAAAVLALPLLPARVGKRHALLPEVRGDATCFVETAAAREALLPAILWFAALQAEVNHGAWLGLRGMELQAAWYAPGSRYERHVDTFHGDPARRLTAILYLQEAWQPEHGGELRVHLLEGPVDVAPIGGRAVVFLADRLEHEVLPTTRGRIALTAWFGAG